MNQNKKRGMIVNCLWAYIYEQPDIYSNVLCAFRMLESIDIVAQDNKDFYCVETKDEKIGYCLKDYIVIPEEIS